jgi:hypothetical protein
MHGATAARSAEAIELSERVQSSQSSGGRSYMRRRGLKSQVHGGKGAKVEAFENLKFFQVLEEKHQNSVGETTVVRLSREDLDH